MLGAGFGPTVAYGQMRRLLRDSLNPRFARTVAGRGAGLSGLCQDPDFSEGVAAFLAKRPAQFAG